MQRQQRPHFHMCLWKHLSHFINTPLSLPFSVIFVKNKFLKYITGLKPPSSYGDKCHSGNRAILILYSSCSVCLSKRSVQSKQSDLRTPQIIRIFSQVCKYFKIDILLSLCIILKSQGRGSALIILSVSTISAFAAWN